MFNRKQEEAIYFTVILFETCPPSATTTADTDGHSDGVSHILYLLLFMVLEQVHFPDFTD